MEAIIDGINYRLNKNNYTASVHRLGPCEQYEGDVNIPSHITYQNCTYTVTEIYGYGWGGAFDCCKSLISVTIPSTVQTIGTCAFRGCSSLVSVILTEGLKDVGPMAFEACKSLSYIEIPKSVTHIGWDAFRDTLWYENQPNGLVYMGDILYSYKGEVSNTSVIIDNGITIIADYAFEKIASKITSINIPNTVKYIGSGVFSGCSSLTFITIPDGVYEIGNNAFSCCSSLETIRIPDSVHRIGTGAFYACDTLKTVILSGNITSLQNTIYTEEPANGFFGRCKSLESIFIPASVKQIDAGTFENCTSLVSIVVHPDNPVYDSRENSNAIIEKHTNKLIAGCYKTIIPIGVKSIGTAAFSCCESLNAIEIPETVTSIGDRAFWYCSSLVSISLPSKITDFSWRKEYYSTVFHGCESLQIIRVPKGKKEEYCKLGLEEYRDLIQEPQEEEYTILLNIAKGYEMGIGMKKNLAQAVLIYSQAADKGCAEAAFHLGELYELGDGLQQDYQQAIEWYTKAIALYHPSAETRKNHCEQVLRNEEQRMEEYQREIQSQFPQLPTTKYIFFDTECNGLPKYYNIDVCITSNWPRLIQLAWIVTDEVGNIVKRQNYIIKPDGFVINDKIAVLTSINTTRAQREGVELVNALSEFMADIEEAQLVIGHNIDFDMHIVGCELFRENMNYNKLMTKPSICTMQKSTNFCAIPINGNHAGYKWPKLEELHQKLFGTTFAGAHDAMSDVEATRKCYFELKKRGIL